MRMMRGNPFADCRTYISMVLAFRRRRRGTYDDFLKRNPPITLRPCPQLSPEEVAQEDEDEDRADLGCSGCDEEPLHAVCEAAEHDGCCVAYHRGERHGDCTYSSQRWVYHSTRRGKDMYTPMIAPSTSQPYGFKLSAWTESYRYWNIR